MKSNPILSKRVASIDIGTNTILLLIAEVNQGEVRPLFEMETVVRLGEKVEEKKTLSKGAMRRGLQTLSQYLERCRAMEVQEIFAVGTSALREAKNSEDFLKLAAEKLDLSVEVISGEEEARLSFLAVAKDVREAADPFWVVDVGGGSTEFILGSGEQVREWISLPLGSVRFTEKFLHSDPVQENEYQKMERKILKTLVDVPRSEGSSFMVAVGGTATTLAAVTLGLEEFVAEKIHHFVLKKETLKNQLLIYRTKTIEQRKKIPGLRPARADVILAGGAILYLAMEELHCPSVLISCHGLRYGLIYDRLTL